MKRSQASSLIAELTTFAAMFFSSCFASPATADEPIVAGRTRAQWQAQLKNENEVAQRQATQALSQFGAAAVWELVTLAKDKNAITRFWALRGLRNAATQSQSSNQKLTADQQHLLVETAEWALTDPAAAVRIEAAVVLGRSGRTDAALELLVKELKNPVDGARIQAADAIEELGPAARPIRAAVQAATGDSSEYVKRITARIIERWEP